MRITRLRRGYRVRLSDAEFEALCFIVRQGQEELNNFVEEDLGHLSLPAREALSTDRFQSDKTMKVDDDRRNRALGGNR